MSNNSNITATTTHTKVALEPNGLTVQPLFSEQLPECLWSTKTTPLLFIPQFDGTQVHYLSSANPQVSADFGATLSGIEELSAMGWADSLSACETLPTGCFVADLTVTLSGGNTLSSVDECEVVTVIDIPTLSSGDFLFTLDLPSTTLSATLSAQCVRSFEDPFPTCFGGTDNNLLDHMHQFDVVDYDGNGILFSHPNTKISQLLQTIFGDPFTGELLDKVKRVDENTNNVDLADLDRVSDMSTLIGIEELGFTNGAPVELESLIKLASLKYEDVFGYDDIDMRSEQFNRGDLLDVDDIISAGEVLFYQETLEPESDGGTVVVPSLNSGLSAMDNSLLSGTETYMLSAMEIECLDPGLFCFWRTTETEPERVGAAVTLGCLSGIPSREEWGDYLQQKIEFMLLGQL